MSLHILDDKRIPEKRCGVIFIRNNRCLDILNQSSKILEQDTIKRISFIDWTWNQKSSLKKFSPRIKHCKSSRPSSHLKIKRNQDLESVTEIIIVKGRLSRIWSLPKGRINNSISESEYECASREVFEETGINLSPDIIATLPRINIGKNIYFIHYVNSNTLFNFSIRDLHEVCEVGWKSLASIRLLNCNKDIRSLLKGAKTTRSLYNNIFIQAELNSKLVIDTDNSSSDDLSSSAEFDTSSPVVISTSNDLSDSNESVNSIKSF